MSMTAVPISIRLVRAAMADSNENGELPLEVVHPDERPVDAELLRRLRQLYGLEQRVGRRPACASRGPPASDRTTGTDLLHTDVSAGQAVPSPSPVPSSPAVVAGVTGT